MDHVLVDRRARGDEDRDAGALPPAGPARSAATSPRSSPGSRPGRRRRAGRCRRRARARWWRRRRGSRRRAGRARSRAAPSAGSRRDSRGSGCAARSLSRSDSRRPVSRISTATRDRPNTIVCRPARRNGSAQRWARVSAEPRAPLSGSRTGGSTSRTCRSPAGAPLRSMSRTGRPVSIVRELGRVPDRRRAADDDRVAAVVGADPQQPAQDVGDVAAEDAAVGVQLVDDDDPELLEQLEPLRVVGEDRRVEHVRVGDHDLAGRPDRRADRRRRVAVVGGRRDRHPGGRGQLAELGDLVLAERLGREEEQRPRRRVLGDRLQDRQRVAERTCPTPSA